MWFGKAAKVRSMKEPVYRVHLDTFGCRACGLVNDCPVFVTRGKRSLMSTYTVNHWLIHGKSRLKILIEPPSGQDALDQQRAFLRGKVTAGDMTIAQDGRPLVELLTFELDLSADTGDYPMLIEDQFDVPTAFPAWLWTRAAPLTLDDALRSAVANAVREVWQALERRDLDRVLELQRIRLRELSQSVFQPIDERMADTRGDLERLTGQAGGRLRPLDADAYQYPLFADSRLVRVDNPADHPVLRYDFPDTSLFAGIPLLFARNEYGRPVWVR